MVYNLRSLITNNDCIIVEVVQSRAILIGKIGLRTSKLGKGRKNVAS